MADEVKKTPKQLKSTKKINRSRLRVMRAAANADRLIDAGYLHSYADTYDAIIKEQGLAGLSGEDKRKVISILAIYRDYKKDQLYKMLQQLGLKDDVKSIDGFLQTFNEGMWRAGEDGQAATDLIEKSVNEALTAFAGSPSGWKEIFDEAIAKFFSDIESGKNNFKFHENKNYYKNQREKHIKGNLSANGAQNIKTAFINWLEANPLEDHKEFTADAMRVIFFGSGESTRYFASMLGAATFGKGKSDFKDLEQAAEAGVNDGMDPRTRKLFRTVLNNFNWDIDTKKMGPNAKSNIVNKVSGELGETVGLTDITNFAIANVIDEFKDNQGKLKAVIEKKGSSQKNGKTVKADIIWELNGVKLGISVKTPQLKPWNGKDMPVGTMMERFKVQDTKLSNLESVIRSSLLDIQGAEDFGITKTINRLYYLILNETFQNYASKKSDGVGEDTFGQRNKNSGVIEYLKGYFMALSSVWLGTSISNINSDFMDVGIIYDARTRKSYAAYELIQALIDGLNQKDVGAKQIRVDISVKKGKKFTAAEGNQYYLSKLDASKGMKGVTNGNGAYNTALVIQGAQNGRAAASRIDIAVVYTYVYSIFKKYLH